MWYTKNNLRIAQTQLQIKIVPDDEQRAMNLKNRGPTTRFNYYAHKINGNSKNIPYLKSLLKNIEGDPNSFIGTDKQILMDKIKELISSKTSSENTNTLNPKLIETKTLNALSQYGVHDISVNSAGNDYFMSVKTPHNGKVYPYLFNFKNEIELNKGLSNLVDRIKQIKGIAETTVEQLEKVARENTEGNQENAPNEPNQELVLLSPVSDGIPNISLPSELLNQYNEARNSGSMIKFEVTKNQNGTNQIAVKEASQYYTQHPKLLEEIRLFLEKNGKFQFATNDAAEVIPGEYILAPTIGLEPINYAPAKLNIFVPGAAEKAPIDLFLDGQKIATVINNTDFTFDNKKYPLLVGKHVLEARAEKTPSLTPIQDKYLKVLSKNRSYYFNVEEGKIPNLTTPINDLSTYKAADAESYGSGLAVKLRENPYRSPEKDLIDNQTKGLHPAFKRYYIVKTRISDNDPSTRANIINRAVALQNAIAASKSLISDDEYENYVTAVLNLEGAGGYATDEQLNAIINKIQVERPNPPAAPGG